MNAMPYGFRCRAVNDRRRLVEHARAFAAYCSCDERASVQTEAYLSAFRFGDEFKQHLAGTDSTAGFAGACWADWLPFDLDNEGNLDAALADAVKLAAGLSERYRIDADALLVFFSGSKGFHVLLPTSLWNPEPSSDFHRVARRFAEQAAARFAVRIDPSIYSIVQPFRAPNSKHPKTGLHKRRLTFDELTQLSLPGILDLAREPLPFDPPASPSTSETAIADWRAAAAAVKQESEGKDKLRTAANGAPTLNRRTLEYIRTGASEGDRHRLLFSAAANLAEFGCPPALAYAILADASLDCGLSPADLRRQIDCGLNKGKAGASVPSADAPPAPATPIPSACPPPDLQAQLRKLWDGAEPRPAAKADESPATPVSSEPGPIVPPADTKLYFIDDRGRACEPADAALWTWTGAKKWYRVADAPISGGA